jgi:hypothetical protein
VMIVHPRKGGKALVSVERRVSIARDTGALGSNLVRYFDPKGWYW